MTTTPRKVLKQEASKAVFATYRKAHAEAQRYHDDEDGGAGSAEQRHSGALPGVSCTANAWLASLRNQQPLPRLQSTNKGDGHRQQAASSPRILSLPLEIVTIVLDYLNKRALTYEVPLVCRSMRLAARQRRYWTAFVLRELVQEDLPIVSRFVALANTFRTQQEHREHFWLRHLAEGRWPSPPTVLDLSTTTWAPRLVAQAIRTSASALRELHLAHCDATLTSEALEGITNALSAANATLSVCSVSFCCRYGPHALVDSESEAAHRSGIGVVGLLASRSCSTLEALDISSCEQLEDADVAAALYRVHTHIRRFECRNTAFSCATFRIMSAVLPKLTHLNVANCGAVDDACLALMRQRCPFLVDLNISGCSHITDIGLAALIDIDAPHVPLALASLTLDDCRAVTDVAVTMLLEACATSLRRLSLDRCTCRGTFLVAAVQSSGLTALSINGCLWIVREAARCVALRKGILASVPRLNARSIAFLVSHRMVPLPVAR